MRPFPFAALAAALALAVVPNALAQRPTPHQAIERALRPVSEQLTQLNATEGERRDVADVIARAEAVASAYVEAQHFGATERAQSLSRRIELFARLVRGRVEAARAESDAAERERAALRAEERRTQSRAALERAVEQRLDLDRQPTTQAPANAPPQTAAPAPATAAPATARPASARPRAQGPTPPTAGGR